MVRHKNRYLLFHVHWFTPSGPRDATEMHILPNLAAMQQAGVDALHAGMLVKAIREAIVKQTGDHGAASTATLNVKYYNAETCVGIVRVPVQQHTLVWATLTTITEIRNVPCTVRVVHSSGTIQRCQKRALTDDQSRLRLVHYRQSLLAAANKKAS